MPPVNNQLGNGVVRNDLGLSSRNRVSGWKTPGVWNLFADIEKRLRDEDGVGVPETQGAKEGHQGAEGLRDRFLEGYTPREEGVGMSVKRSQPHAYGSVDKLGASQPLARRSIVDPYESIPSVVAYKVPDGSHDRRAMWARQVGKHNLNISRPNTFGDGFNSNGTLTEGEISRRQSEDDRSTFSLTQREFPSKPYNPNTGRYDLTPRLNSVEDERQSRMNFFLGQGAESDYDIAGLGLDRRAFGKYAGADEEGGVALHDENRQKHSLTVDPVTLQQKWKGHWTLAHLEQRGVDTEGLGVHVGQDGYVDGNVVDSLFRRKRNERRRLQKESKPASVGLAERKESSPVSVRPTVGSLSESLAHQKKSREGLSTLVEADVKKENFFESVGLKEDVDSVSFFASLERAVKDPSFSEKDFIKYAQFAALRSQSEEQGKWVQNPNWFIGDSSAIQSEMLGFLLKGDMEGYRDVLFKARRPEDPYADLDPLYYGI